MGAIVVVEAEANYFIGIGVICTSEGTILSGYVSGRVVIADVGIGAGIVSSIGTCVVNTGVGIGDQK